MIAPLSRRTWLATDDSMEFADHQTIGYIPVGDHVGAYQAVRKHDTHMGVDIYGVYGEPVYAMQDGVIESCDQFTGPEIGMPWWNTTYQVTVNTGDQSILYGEVYPNFSVVTPNAVICKSEIIGWLIPVLRRNKGRPMTMLHLELRECDTVIDPTPMLMSCLGIIK